MKREQKVFAILMAASMAFIGISGTTTASAAPVSFQQVQLGNYIDDGSAPAVEQPADRVLSSGRKVVKKTNSSSKRKVISKKTAKKTNQVISKEEAAKKKSGKRKVIKRKQTSSAKAATGKSTLSSAQKS